MKFSEKVINVIKERHILNHPFYQDWNEGKLEKDTLKEYTRQYFQHVDAFPRYVSATHSLCENIQDRQVLLENLVDEEKGEENHPELWMRFGEGLGQNREGMTKENINPETMNLVETFQTLSRSSYAEGLASLFAYEFQVPEVAKVKIDGLKKFYDVNDERTLKFFEVHKTADVYHSEACQKQLDNLPVEEQPQALEAAKKAADALWKFLDGVQSRRVNAA